MKKILFAFLIFCLSIFSMDQQVATNGFESNIGTISCSDSEFSEDESSYDIEDAIIGLQTIVGAGLKVEQKIGEPAENMSLTESSYYMYTCLQVMSNQLETQKKELEAHKKEVNEKLFCYAKVITQQDAQIKKLEEENKKQKEEIATLTATILSQLRAYESERSYRQLNKLREKYQQSIKTSNPATSSTEMVRVKELSEEKAPESPRKEHRFSCELKQIAKVKKRSSPRGFFRRRKKRENKKKTYK